MIRMTRSVRSGRSWSSWWLIPSSTWIDLSPLEALQDTWGGVCAAAAASKNKIKRNAPEVKLLTVSCIHTVVPVADQHEHWLQESQVPSEAFPGRRLCVRAGHTLLAGHTALHCKLQGLVTWQIWSRLRVLTITASRMDAMLPTVTWPLANRGSFQAICACS